MTGVKRGPDCTVCLHPALHEIDIVLATEPNRQRALARQYGLGHDAMCRHAKNHVPQRIARGFSLRSVTECKDLTARIELLLLETVDILEDARETHRDVTCPHCEASFSLRVNDIRSRVAAAGECRQTLRLVGEVTGKIASGQVLALFQALGVRDEPELRRLVEAGRARANITHREALEDGVALLQMLFREHKEWQDPVMRRLLPPSSAAVVEEAAPETNGHGNGLAPAGGGP